MRVRGRARKCDDAAQQRRDPFRSPTNEPHASREARFLSSRYPAIAAWFDSEAEKARLRALPRLQAHTWPHALLAVLETLRGAGGQAWVVGGSVRDVLLERTGGDPDVATDLRPAQVQALFARTEPIGERHGTVLILHDGLAIECTTFRREGAYADARHPDEVWFTHDPLEDLDRRDLTVNALAFDPASGTLLDPHGGARDVERRVLRAVGEPEARFREDALRPLRVARFCATLEFEPEPETRKALGVVADRAPLVAIERVRAEFEALMRAREPSRGWELLRECGLLALWLPELAAARGVPQNRFHAYDVYFHSLYSCDAAPAEKPVVRWAALLHDLGKPATRVERDGEGTFYDHQFVGAEMADALLERLRFPAAFREAVVHLVREHMFDYRTEWSDAALRRWLRRVGPECVADLFDLRIADTMGNGKRTGSPRQLHEMARRIERELRAGGALRIRDLAVSGADVMQALGVPPGPVVGKALAALLEEVLDDPARNTREHLLARLAAQRERLSHA